MKDRVPRGGLNGNLSCSVKYAGQPTPSRLRKCRSLHNRSKAVCLGTLPNKTTLELSNIESYLTCFKAIYDILKQAPLLHLSVNIVYIVHSNFRWTQRVDWNVERRRARRCFQYLLCFRNPSRVSKSKVPTPFGPSDGDPIVPGIFSSALAAFISVWMSFTQTKPVSSFC